MKTSLLGLCHASSHGAKKEQGTTNELAEEVTPEAALRMKEKHVLCEVIHAYVAKHKGLQDVCDPGDRYRRLRKLGQGAQGVVYRVEDLETKQRYALKEVAKPGTERNFANCMEWKALLTEIEVLSEIRHEGCVKLHELMMTEDHIYMVIELVRGTSLQQYAAMNPVTERDASEIAAHVLNALQYLHVEKKIVHRDIKPENILIAAKKGPVEEPRPLDSNNPCKVSGTVDCSEVLPLGTNGDRFVVKLVDFGSSRFCAPGLLGGRYGDVPMTTVNDQELPAATPVGTSLYLALETINIALGDGDVGRQVDWHELPKVDIFSLGVVMYMLLCRQHPFMGNLTDGLTSMKQKMVNGDTGETKLDFPPDADLDYPLSSQSKDFIGKTLALKACDRLTAQNALLHPWVVCRHYRCCALREKPITAWDATACSGYIAPEELVKTEPDGAPPTKRRNVGSM